MGLPPTLEYRICSVSSQCSEKTLEPHRWPIRLGRSFLFSDISFRRSDLIFGTSNNYKLHKKPSQRRNFWAIFKRIWIWSGWIQEGGPSQKLFPLLWDSHINPNPILHRIGQLPTINVRSRLLSNRFHLLEETQNNWKPPLSVRNLCVAENWVWIRRTQEITKSTAKSL